MMAVEVLVAAADMSLDDDAAVVGVADVEVGFLLHRQA